MTRYSDKSKEYSIAYAKAKLKRIPLDYPLEDLPDLQAAAQQVGESVNGFIKTAIRERIDKLNESRGLNE